MTEITTIPAQTPTSGRGVPAPMARPRSAKRAFVAEQDSPIFEALLRTHPSGRIVAQGLMALHDERGRTRAR